MSANPNFASIVSFATIRLSVANASLLGTGTGVVLLIAPVGGTKITRVRIKARGPTTAGMIRFFASDGTIISPMTEVPVVAVTPSATVESWSGEATGLAGLALPNGAQIFVTTERAELFHVWAELANF